MLRNIFLVLIAVCLTAAACAQPSEQSAAPGAQKAPVITLTKTRVVHPSRFEMHGSGFTPKRNALSHLKRPDGTEFPVLTLLSNDRGEFTHEIESLLLAVGTHELWVFDEATGVSSNVARFEVVRE